MMTARTASSPRPRARPTSAYRSARRLARFWLPPALIAALTASLLLLWPHPKHHPLRSMPEASAAYVMMTGVVSYVLSPEAITRSWDLSSEHGSRLSDFETMAPRLLPPARYAPMAADVWGPARLDSLSNAVPDLAALTPVVPAPVWGPAPANRWTVVLSANLRDAGFRLAMPAAASTNEPGTARFYVDLDEQGSVAHVLAEPSEHWSGTRAVEAAIFTSRADRAASGTVEVSWGK